MTKQKELAERFNVAQCTISDIKTGSSMRKITRTSRMSDAEFAIFIENSPVSGGGYLGEEFPSNAVADVPYTNLPTPMPSDMATEQTGSFASSVGSYSNRFTQGVNSQAKVFVTGTGVIRNGYTSQSSLQASLAEGSCTLIGNVSDSYNRVTNPATGIYKWVSLNSMIATVSNNGLVHFLRKGQVTIECRYSRQANASYAGSTPSGTEFAYGTCEIQIVN
jgi:transcriptional regulator with XRE-family HTH domain